PVISSAKSSTSGFEGSIENPPPPSARTCGIRPIASRCQTVRRRASDSLLRSTRSGPAVHWQDGPMRTAVLTISTSVSRRESEDESGPLLAQFAEEAGCDVEAMEVVPDDYALIEDRRHNYVDGGVRFIFTTGGTGMTPDDGTPAW